MPASARWHPVTPASGLRAGDNLVAALAQGQALALWRSASGLVQAWEDRCPHRGVALSLGRVYGERLACAYHGWEYAAGSGRCVAIPAMPEIAVPGRVCVRSFAALERQGMVWVNIGADPQADAAPQDDGAAPHFLRSMALDRPIDTVEKALPAHGFQRLAAQQWRGTLEGLALRLFTLDAAPEWCQLHLASESPPGAGTMPGLFAAARMLRTAIEGASA